MRNRIPKKQIEFLRAVPLFSACTGSELRSIAQLGTPVGAEEGAYLTRQGAVGREFFLVLDGVASCRVRKKEVRRFRTGSYFGELALLHGGMRGADVVAVSPMDLLVLRHQGVSVDAGDDAEHQREDAGVSSGAAGGEGRPVHRLSGSVRFAVGTGAGGCSRSRRPEPAL